ncbi:signal peptidase I [uncultured Campylobacter sp.]|uniref:signal peptidase I n=1 Tax=uncultured Campylobacter sp. TaxID=218934 RepID=UPI0026135B8D|nr:signal peptidase I [uncultured Campylobacter sp.]
MNFFKKLSSFSNSWLGTIIIVLLLLFFCIQAFTIPSGSMKNSLLVGDFLFVKKFSYGIPTPHLPWIELPVLPDFDGDGHLISAKGPQRGDIVVFRYPKEPKIHFVKRCVAKGNDEVIITANALYVSMSEGDEYMKKHYPNDLVYIKNKLFVKEPYKNKGIHYDKGRDLNEIFQIALSLDKFAMQAENLSEFGEMGFSGANAYSFVVPENEYFMMGDNRTDSEDSRFWGSVPYKYIVGKPWFVYFSIDSQRNIRWDRVGRFVDTLQNDEKFIRENGD